MQAQRASYSLNLTFAEQGRALASDVSIRISDAAGNLLLEALNCGPLLYTKQAPEPVPSGA